MTDSPFDWKHEPGLWEIDQADRFSEELDKRDALNEAENRRAE